MISIPSGIRLMDKTNLFLENEQKMLVGGAWVGAKSGKTFQTLNPATGEILAEIPLADQVDVDEAVYAARKSFESVWLEKTTPSQRADLIWKLAVLIERDKQKTISQG